MNQGHQDLVRTFCRTFGGPVFVLDTDLRYLEFNEEHRRVLLELYGTVPAVGTPILDLIPEGESRDLARANLERALAGEFITEDTPFDPETQGALCYRVSHQPVVNVQGLVGGVLVTARDITAEARAKAESLRDKQRLQEALEASGVAEWSYDGTTGETHFSDRYFLMLGYEPGEFSPTLESWVDLLHPDDRDPAVQSFRTFIQTDSETFRLEFRLRTASGNWRWILGQARVTHRDARGLPKRVSGTNIDITWRKMVELSLLESEARWTSLVNEAPTGVVILNRQGQVMFFNNYARERLGFIQVGGDWKRCLPPPNHAEMDRVLAGGFEEGLPLVFSTWRQSVDGSVLHFENHSNPIREGGEVTGLVVLSNDVTAQTEAEAHRVKAGRRMEVLLSLHERSGTTRQDLVDAALDGAVRLTDSQIGYVYYYSEATRLFTLHAWSNQVMDQCRVTDPQTTYQLDRTGYWGEAVRQRKPILVNDFPTTTPFHRGLPAGHVALTRFLTIPVFEAGAIVAVIGVGNKVLPYDQDDVAELTLLADNLWQLQRRRDAEETLQRLYHAIEHAPVSVVITDLQGNIVYSNPRFSSLTGYTAEEVRGKDYGVLKSDMVPPEIYTRMLEQILSGQEWQGELVSKKKSGESFSEWVSISPVLDLSGAITHFVSLNEDLTERKAAEALLFQAQKMESVGQLAAGVAHDFNNLLTSMLTYNQMVLRKLPPGDPVRLYAERTEVAGNRAAALVTGLLAVGRQQRLTQETTDLGNFLRGEEALLATLVTGDLRLAFDLAAVPLPVSIDVGQVSQVVVNLVSNARDALGGRGTIVVATGSRTEGPTAWAWFSVTDDGPGIPEALLTKIFDPFFTTKEIGKGTGMGLSIVQGIVHQHQGTLVARNCPGGGAEFMVSFPLTA